MRKVAKRTIERECPAGVARTAFVVAVSMNGSSVEGKEPQVDSLIPADGRLSTRSSQPLGVGADS